MIEMFGSDVGGKGKERLDQFVLIFQANIKK